MSGSGKRPTEAYQSNTLFEQGMGYVTVARFKLSGETEVGVFLIDTYCLGVKNAFFTRVWDHEYDGEFLGKVFAREGKTGISPSCARKLVQDAVEYANQLGFSPHSDYREAARVLGGIDPSKCERTFVFGSEGKPFYVQGPDDSPARVQAILGQLRNRSGDGNFDFVLSEGSQG